MAFFYPEFTETRLIHLTAGQLQTSLERHIKPISERRPEDESNAFLFNGMWNESGFSVSLKLKISNNFVPVISGSFIPSEEGILVKLHYQLFPATKKLLLFWTVLTLLITLFFIGVHQAWLYGAISFGFCLVNYILSRENFKIQIRKSKRMLDKMLS